LGSLIFPEYDKVISNIIAENKIFSPSEFNFIKNNVKDGDVCINVGANVGYFAALMSKLVGTNGKVFAIEANPNFEFCLRKNVQKTGYKNTEVIISAAGDETGYTDLFINMYNCGDNRVYNPLEVSNMEHDNFYLKGDPIRVKIDKVDNLVKTDRLDFILTDCQGWDHKVIRGMRNLINLYKPYIIFEFVPEWISKVGESPEDILEEFENMGYDIFCLDLDIYGASNFQKFINSLSKDKLNHFDLHMKPKNK
jgi:FkbM family methyltransferase